MSEQHVVTALREKRATLDGELRQVEKRATQLRLDLATIDAALVIFDPTIAPHTIRAKVPRPNSSDRQHGGFTRAVLDAVRCAEAPVSARDIALVIAPKLGLDVSTSHARQAIIGRVRSALGRGRDGLASERRGDTVFWRVQ